MADEEVPGAPAPAPAPTPKLAPGELHRRRAETPEFQAKLAIAMQLHERGMEVHAMHAAFTQRTRERRAKERAEAEAAAQAQAEAPPEVPPETPPEVEPQA